MPNIVTFSNVDSSFNGFKSGNEYYSSVNIQVRPLTSSQDEFELLSLSSIIFDIQNLFIMFMNHLFRSMIHVIESRLDSKMVQTSMN